MRLRWKFHPFWVCCIEAIGSGRPVSLSLCEIDVSLGLDQRFGTYGRVLFGSAIFAGECVCGRPVVDAVGSAGETLIPSYDVNMLVFGSMC